MEPEEMNNNKMTPWTHNMQQAALCQITAFFWLGEPIEFNIADYVTNICEQIIYTARGQVIKHSEW